MNMSSVRFRRFPAWCSQAVMCGVGIAALVVTVHSQVGLPGSQQLDELIKKVKTGQFTPATLHQIIEVRAVQAIPILKEQFATVSDPLTKQALASALVRLGDPDRVYWEFVADRARVAIESDAPFPNAFDEQGRVVPLQLSPGFLAWAKAKNIAPDVASNDHAFMAPLDVTFLAATGDVRGLELLRRGMSSRNHFVQAVSARGLARLRDRDSVPAIIQACRKAPAQACELIARALPFFDDARANTAAEAFISNQEVLEELRRLSREKGPESLF